MNQNLKTKLQNKMVDVSEHLDNLKDKKKLMAKNLGAEIKGAESKIRAITSAIKKDDIDYLRNGFDEDEIDELMV